MLKSVIAKDMDKCLIYGTSPVHIHHVFPGSRRKACEKYGFVVPLCPELHTLDKQSVHMNPNQGLDLALKMICQTYFEDHYGTREEFIKEFHKSYL